MLANLWDKIDPWIAARLSKTGELVTRVAAQLAHIEITMVVLQEFIAAKNIVDPFSPVSLDRYYELKSFIRARRPPSTAVVISGEFTQSNK